MINELVKSLNSNAGASSLLDFYLFYLTHTYFFLRGFSKKKKCCIKVIYFNYAHRLFLCRVPPHASPHTLLSLNLLVQINVTKKSIN